MRDLVTVFGGSGFVGSQVVRALARGGWRVRVGVRYPASAYRLPMAGDVGQIEVVRANIRDEGSVAAALEGAGACVNCVGVLRQGGRQTFAALHAEAAGAVARRAAAVGVSRFVQVSALGADSASPSAYARTKAAGEAAVRAAIPSAVILRPSVVFGPGDAFFNRFAAMAMIAPALPLIGGGHTRFQPVYVGDVATAALSALGDPAAAGRDFELGGPSTYSFADLMRLMLAETGRSRLLLPVPFGIAGVLGLAGDLAGLVGFPAPITGDQVRLLRRDNVVAPGVAGLAELGVAPSAVEPVIPTYLYRYRKGGQYAETHAAATPAAHPR